MIDILKLQTECEFECFGGQFNDVNYDMVNQAYSFVDSTAKIICSAKINDTVILLRVRFYVSIN